MACPCVKALSDFFNENLSESYSRSVFSSEYFIDFSKNLLPLMKISEINFAGNLMSVRLLGRVVQSPVKLTQG